MFTTNLLRLLHLCDPALPIGGFSHSAGLETYVQQDVVRDKRLQKNLLFSSFHKISITLMQH
jgi:urease accessory protein UreF